MASFDPTSNADLLTVQNEVTNDPTGRGYAAAAGDQGRIVELLNEKTATTVTRPVDDIDVSEVAAIIENTDYAALSEYDKEWVKMLITRPTGVSLKVFKSKFLAIFSGTSTETAAQGLQQVAGSRMEILFEYGDVITREDWHAARQAV